MHKQGQWIEIRNGKLAEMTCWAGCSPMVEDESAAATWAVRRPVSSISEWRLGGQCDEDTEGVQQVIVTMVIFLDDPLLG